MSQNTTVTVLRVSGGGAATVSRWPQDEQNRASAEFGAPHSGH
nr:hypothetical protein [Streptomyces scabichelini]